MSQQADTFNYGSRSQHDEAYWTLRERTRNALSISVPGADVPALPKPPYDHMAEWTKKQEVGAIASYEATHGIVSPLSPRKVEQDLLPPSPAGPSPSQDDLDELFDSMVDVRQAEIDTSPADVSSISTTCTRPSSPAPSTSYTTSTLTPATTIEESPLEPPPPLFPLEPPTPPLSITHLDFDDLHGTGATVNLNRRLGIHQVPPTPPPGNRAKGKGKSGPNTSLMTSSNALLRSCLKFAEATRFGKAAMALRRLGRPEKSFVVKEEGAGRFTFSVLH